VFVLYLDDEAGETVLRDSEAASFRASSGVAKDGGGFYGFDY
jgi:hypothetical protein